MDRFLIRPFEERDVLEVSNLEKECFSSPWSENALRDELSNKNSLFLVCLYENRVVGYIGSIFVCDEMNITNVAVLSDMRRKGIGENLIKTLIQQAKQKNIKEIFLEVRESNFSAQALYNKLGFVFLGKRRDFYSSPREDAILMKYTIDG